MKKIHAVIAITVLAASLLGGCSKGYETRKTAGDLTIALSAGTYPLTKGNNVLTVKVSDAAGKAITDAQVSMRFFMPPMPGMAPMESNLQGVPKGDGYAFTVNPPMEGGWKAEVTAVRPGAPAATAVFNLDAR